MFELARREFDETSEAGSKESEPLPTPLLAGEGR